MISRGTCHIVGLVRVQNKINENLIVDDHGDFFAFGRPTDRLTSPPTRRLFNRDSLKSTDKTWTCLEEVTFYVQQACRFDTKQWSQRAVSYGIEQEFNHCGSHQRHKQSRVTRFKYRVFPRLATREGISTHWAFEILPNALILKANQTYTDIIILAVHINRLW